MDTNQDLRMALGWNRFNLKCVGVWPEPRSTPVRSGLSRYRFIIPSFFMFAFICGPQFANLPLIWGNIDLVAENLATASIPTLSAFTKLVFVGYHKNELRPLVKSFYDDWHGSKTELERIRMVNSAKTANRISIGCTILDAAMVSVFLTNRLLTLYNTDRDQVNQDRIILYPGYFPYNIRKNSMFEFTMLGQIAAACCAIFSYTGVDGFVSMLVLHTCAQFSNLRSRLENLVKTEIGIMDPEEFRRELSWIAKRHEHLNWFGNTIEEAFNFMLLLQMLFCVLHICFQGFQTFQIFLQGKNENLLVQLLFLILILSVIGVHLYIYCYLGEMLLVQSIGIGDSAYNSKWYNVQAVPARSLLIVMYRSMSPVHLTAGKFSTFSLEMFSTVLKTSLGYLSVLLTVVSETS